MCQLEELSTGCAAPTARSHESNPQVRTLPSKRKPGQGRDRKPHAEHRRAATSTERERITAKRTLDVGGAHTAYVKWGGSSAKHAGPTHADSPARSDAGRPETEVVSGRRRHENKNHSYLYSYIDSYDLSIGLSRLTASTNDN